MGGTHRQVTPAELKQERDMQGLIKRLEAASEPSRELDEAICVAVGRPLTFDDGVVSGCNVKPYTSSIDAALMLVPEGFAWAVAMDLTAKGAHAGLHRRFPYTAADGKAKTPALAIVIAALKAKGGEG